MSHYATGRRWLRAFVTWPAFHFVLLGTMLFGLEQELSNPSSVGVDRKPIAAQPVVITASQVEQLRKDWQRNHGRLPSRSEEKDLLEGLVSEELLFQEALRLGLDRDDLVIYRRLTEKMRLLGEDPSPPAEQLYREAAALGLGRDDLIVRRRLIQRMRLMAEAEGGAVRPPEAEIQDYYRRHSERFQQPARVQISHVFLRRGRHAGEQEARRLLDELERQGTTPTDADFLGDPFPLGHHFPLRTLGQLERDFGAQLAARAMDFEPGHWNGPVESAYGWHVIWVHEVRPASRSDLETVRRLILEDLREERCQERLTDLLKRLRSQYSVRIDAPSLNAGDRREEVG